MRAGIRRPGATAREKHEVAPGCASLRRARWAGDDSPVKAAMIAAAVLASAAVASAVYQEASDRADRRCYPPPGRLVDVGGRNLHLVTAGEGGPPVLVIPALADDVTTWIPVVKAAAARAETAVHVYDRAGCGWSDLSPARVTFETMADDLHALMAAAGTGPCIIAGHSVGGIIARQLHARHPEDVTGMLLIDSSHERQFRRLPWRAGERKLLARIISRQARPLGAYRLAAGLGLIPGTDVAGYEADVPAELAAASLSIDLSTRHRRAVVAETLEMSRPHDPPQPLGQLPVTVITSLSKMTADFLGPWRDMQDDLAGLSADTVRLDAGDAGHHVHRDDPGLVVQAVADIARRCRHGSLSAPHGNCQVNSPGAAG